MAALTPPPPPDEWHDLAARVPRRDQIVRIRTVQGTDHVVQFVVAHTENWPSGAWWAFQSGDRTLPFHAVASWSPNPHARLPEPSPSPPRTGAGGDPEPRPAIFVEAFAEIERTETVLRLLPVEPIDWSPHPDVPNLRTLAQRLVRIVARMGWILELDSMELSFEPDLPDLKTPGELAATFAANAETVRAAAESLDGGALRSTWVLERNGLPIVKLPRGNAFRQFGITPLVYHRAEIALLLTAMSLPVPHPYPLWAFTDAPAA